MNQWIGGGHFFRRNIEINRNIERAKIKISGLGYFVLFVNDRRVGDDYLVPAQTNYEKIIYFLEYDLTLLLSDGNNWLTAALGEGFFAQSLVTNRFGWAEPYGERRLWCELLIDYKDQTHEVIKSDDQWQVTDGPYLSDNIYYGDYYDARWSEMDSTIWQKAQKMDAPGGELVLQKIVAEKVVRTLRALHIEHKTDDRIIYDFGENISGWGLLNIRAPRGTLLTMRYSEECDNNGELNFDSTGVFATHYIQTDRYICAGNENGEVFHSEFCYHGFRFIELTGADRDSNELTLMAQEVRTGVSTTGTFKSSDALLNQLYEMSVRTLSGNLHSLPTDCPAREKCGWLGDAQAMGKWASFQFDLSDFWEKYTNDIKTSAIDGLPTMIAPGRRICGVASPAWGITCVIIPYLSYQFYGNKKILSEHYPMMRNWVTYLASSSKDGIVEQGLGDWCPPGSCRPLNTKVSLTSTVMFYQSAFLAEKIAKILHFDEDASKFGKLTKDIKQAFIANFFNQEIQEYGSQTGNALALYFELYDKEKFPVILQALKNDFRNRANHISCGILGMRYLFEVLAKHGEIDLAYDILHSEGYPSFRETIRQGATTMWENWEKHPADESYPRSRNHPMQTGFAIFFYQILGGIVLSDDFGISKKLTIKPYFPTQLQQCTVTFRSIHGEIATSWKRENGKISLIICVPEDCIVELIKTNNEITLQHITREETI